MEAPPPYYAAGPKKSNVGLIVLIVVGVIGICCILPSVGLGIFSYGFFKKTTGFMGCGTRLDQLRNGLLAYAKAHNGALPPKDRWQDDLQTYLKPLPKNSGIQLPPDNSDVCDIDAKSGVTYNSDLAGKKLKTIEDESAIVLWEVSQGGHNLSAPFNEPSYTSGPSFFGNVPRGWILQPIAGEPYFKNEKGIEQPVPIMGRNGPGTFDLNVDDENGKVDVKTKTHDVKVKSGGAEVKVSSDGE